MITMTYNLTDMIFDDKYFTSKLESQPLRTKLTVTNLVLK